MLQQFSLALGHLMKDHLVVVASVFLDRGPHSLQTLTAGRVVPMSAPLLHPELLHASFDLLLRLVTSPRCATRGLKKARYFMRGHQRNLGKTLSNWTVSLYN